MSGHSKWATIKRKKGAQDTQRSKLWAKLLRYVEVAARQGGGNIEGNASLASAVEKAKANSVPHDNIQRAIKRGTGDLEGEAFEEVAYEGYGAGGVAVLVECLTNNRNRTAQDVRSTFVGKGGKLAEPGAVSWMFDQKGVITIDAAATTEETVFLVAADAGAEDIRPSQDSIEVVTPPSGLQEVLQALEAGGIPIDSHDVTRLPKSTVAVEGADAKKILDLVDALEELDDVQEVYANFDISDEVLASVAS
jgi:YebC/PmpR family DNA-binding regulatory protein